VRALTADQADTCAPSEQKCAQPEAKQHHDKLAAWKIFSGSGVKTECSGTVGIRPIDGS